MRKGEVNEQWPVDGVTVDEDVELMLERCEQQAETPGYNGGPVFTTWEYEFLDSIREQWDSRDWLSERQTEVLEELYGRCCCADEKGYW